MEIVKIYSKSTGRQVAEYPLKDMIRDGWTWDEFAEAQLKRNRWYLLEVNDVPDTQDTENSKGNV